MSHNLHRWLGSYVRQMARRRAPRAGQPVHLLLCIADHFECRHGAASASVAYARIRRWVDEYPRLFGRFFDTDDAPPRHTFFYPLEQYNAAEVEALAELCRA